LVRGSSCAVLLLVSALSACGDDAAEGETVTPGNGSPSTAGDGGPSGDGDMSQLPPGSSGDGDIGGDAGGQPGDGDSGQPLTPQGLPKGEVVDGWTWVEVPGTTCRDGSPAGYHYRLGKSKNLVIFLNGGGACADSFFCGLNQKNVKEDMQLTYLIEGTDNLLLGPSPSPNRQLPPVEGIFKPDARNPVGDWNMIFVPYCTGDIHAGVNKDIEVPGVAGTQQFTGYSNYGSFLESYGPAFVDAEQVLLTGSSAGGFGTLLNFDRTQEWFDAHGGAQVTAISDSGIPMRDEYMAPCLQARWRKYWGVDKIPAMVECGEPCQHADGGGLTEGLSDYIFHKKYAGRMLGGAVSTKEDEVIRAFFAPGNDNCSVDPAINTVFSALYLSDAYPGSKFSAGLKDAAESFGLDQLGYYGWSNSTHMHLWRPDYYVDNGTGTVMADWVADILAGKNTKVGEF
jgi:hypothetical protein